MNLRSLAAQTPDFGETFYVVDTNYRTAAQGWSKADFTGPLDLVGQRNPGRVFYGAGGGTLAPSGSYATDNAAIQAALDEMVDFRGDKLFVTPGAYSLAAAVAVNVPGARLVGPPVLAPRRAAVTVTDAIGDGLAISVDDVELAFMKLVPLTAQNILAPADGADGGYLHHLFYSTVGVTASTSTEFINAAATTSDWLVRDCSFLVSGLQGDCFTWATATRWIVEDCDFTTLTASYATVFTLATSCVGNIVRRCYFTADADGTYTNIFTGAANEDQQLLVAYCIVNGTALATATAIETGFGTTTDIELVENYQTGDATTQGGVLITLA